MWIFIVIHLIHFMIWANYLRKMGRMLQNRMVRLWNWWIRLGHLKSLLTVQVNNSFWGNCQKFLIICLEFLHLSSVENFSTLVDKHKHWRDYKNIFPIKSIFVNSKSQTQVLIRSNHRQLFSVLTWNLAIWVQDYSIKSWNKFINLVGSIHYHLYHYKVS